MTVGCFMSALSASTSTTAQDPRAATAPPAGRYCVAPPREPVKGTLRARCARPCRAALDGTAPAPLMGWVCPGCAGSAGHRTANVHTTDTHVPSGEPIAAVKEPEIHAPARIHDYRVVTPERRKCIAPRSSCRTSSRAHYVPNAPARHETPAVHDAPNDAVEPNAHPARPAEAPYKQEVARSSRSPPTGESPR